MFLSLSQSVTPPRASDKTKSVFFQTEMAQQPKDPAKEEEEAPPKNNGEYVKAVFFYKLSEDTKDETMKGLCGKFGEMDYCFMAVSKTWKNKIWPKRINALGIFVAQRGAQIKECFLILFGNRPYR